MIGESYEKLGLMNKNSGKADIFPEKICYIILN